MLVDTKHLCYWIDAIRCSPDPFRTMEAFWQGQILSKEWLIEQLVPVIVKHCQKKSIQIDIFGGWVGILASLLFQSNQSIRLINSIDIDPNCQSIAEKMNKLEEIEGRFKAICADICDFTSTADIIINTSVEHITKHQYNRCLSKISSDTIIVLQSNNYDIPEHINICKNLDDFMNQTKLSTIFYCGELDLPLYKRFMVIGKKHV